MKKAFLFLALTGIFAAANAEVIKNPDSGTLWLENGKNIKIADKNTSKDFVWRKTKLKITSHPEKGFVMEGNGNTGMYIPSSTAYPWLCLDIASVERIGNGYHGLSIVPASKMRASAVVSRILRGTYYYSLAKAPGISAKPRSKYMRLDLHNAKLHINSISMLKTPPCLPIVTPAAVKKGDTVTVRCKLNKKPQYVEFKFYQTYTMPNLKPSKEVRRCEAKEVPGSNGLEWSYTFPYKGFAGATYGRNKTGFKSGEVLLQIIVEDEEKVADHFFFLPNTFQ